MPYVDKAARERLDPEILHLIERIYKDRLQLEGPPTPIAEIVGELNYCITRLLLSTKPRRYSDFNALIGVLECAKEEFYRMRVAPYEDKKKEENGDVQENPIMRA